VISLIAQPFIDLVFPKVAGWLDKALGKHSNMTVTRLYEMCRTGGGLLFVDVPEEPQNALVCQFDEHRGKRVLVVLAMGGKGGQNWNKLFDEVCSWAKAFGASEVIFEGRFGWQRVLPKVKPVKQTYVMEL
jgi:hypothetical protein